jgi:hypothetical protein
LELFARDRVDGWRQWGLEVDTYAARRAVHPMYDSDEKSDYVFAS